MGRNHLQFFRFLHIIGMIFTKWVNVYNYLINS
jgi:hypothetical protein